MSARRMDVFLSKIAVAWWFTRGKPSNRLCFFDFNENNMGFQPLWKEYSWEVTLQEILGWIIVQLDSWHPNPLKVSLSKGGHLLMEILQHMTLIRGIRSLVKDVKDPLKVVANLCFLGNWVIVRCPYLSYSNWWFQIFFIFTSTWEMIQFD